MQKWYKEHQPTMAGIAILVLITAIAVLLPQFLPYSYSGQDAVMKNMPGSFQHWFGTDRLGRDIFVRVCYGVRVSLLIGLGSTLINGIIGMLYGGIAGFAGGLTEMILMRIVDVISSIPSLLYVILINLVLGSGITGMIIGICIAGWTGTARIVRGEVMRLKEMDYIAAARLAGVPAGAIFFKYLLPGTAGPLIVNLTFLIPQAIFTEAFLSFVGIGIAAPMASLGTLIQDARSQLQLYPWQMMYPILVLCLLVVSVSLIGTDMEDAVKRRGGVR